MDQNQTNPSNELNKLYAEKGEVVTQLEIGQAKLQQLNSRIVQILGIPQGQPPQPVQR